MKLGPGGMWVPEYDAHSFVIRSHAELYLELERYLEPGYQAGTAIDVGAHVGYWTDLMRRDFQHVLALEPQEGNFECLFRNVSHHPNVVVYRLAASDHNGTAVMSYNVGARPNNSGAWHAIPSNEGDVSLRQLDDIPIHTRVYLLKLDVEGYEHEVLMGASHILKTHRPLVVIEVNTAAEENYGGENGAAVSRLKPLGYEMVTRRHNDCVYKWRG